MGNWTNADPGDGDTGQMGTAVTDLGNKATKVDTVVTNVHANYCAVDESVWSGESVVSWQQRLITNKLRVSALGDVFEKVQAAVETYKGSVQSIANSAVQWQEDVKEATWTLNTPVMISADATDDERWDAMRPQRRAQDKLETAQSQLASLGNSRTTADNDLASAIWAALPPGWAETYSALAAAGFSSLNEVGNVGEIEQQLLDLVNRINNRDLDPETSAALAAMLELYGDDETIMSGFYEELGGEKTVELIDNIAWMGQNDWLTEAAAIALAGLVRSGLSVASRNWTENRSEDFVAGLFDGGNMNDGDEIGYLFDGLPDSPLGENLAIAAANQIDQLERENGQTWMSQPPVGGGLWLSMMENGMDGNRVSDASGPIFSTLGQYPDAAFDFLTNSENGSDRVDYWYHDRYEYQYWYERVAQGPPWFIGHDGYQGPADLWFGAQQADGGPASPDADGPASPRDVAILSSDIMQALVTSEHFTSDHISDAASMSLAAGFVMHMPGLSQYPINADFAGDFTSGAQLLDDGTWVPVISDDQLAVFLGRAGSHESGAEVLQFGVSSYQETLLNMAMESGNPLDIQMALDRMVDLQGALEGATRGQLIDDAQGTDAQREAIVSGVTSVLGAIPIPGIGDAAGGITKFVLNWGQGIALGNVTGVGSDAIADLWATQTERTMEQFEADREGSLEDSTRFTIANSLYEYFSAVDEANADVPGYEPYLDGISAPPTGNDAEDRNAWYGGNGGALQEVLGTWVQGTNPESVFSYNFVDQLVQGYDETVGSWAGRVDDFNDFDVYEPQR